MSQSFTEIKNNEKQEINRNNSNEPENKSQMPSQAVLKKPNHNGSVQPPAKKRQKKGLDYMVNQQQHIEKLQKRQNFKFVLQEFLNGKIFNAIQVFLIAVYTLLMFLFFALSSQSGDGDTDTDLGQQIEITLIVLFDIEYAIVILFSIEILCKVYALSIKYLKDYWNAFDAVVIFLSLVLLTTTLVYSDEKFLKISKIFRTFFRLLRILVVFRKIKEIDRKDKELHNQSDKTPVERILSILDFLKEQMQNQKFEKDLQWAIEMVSTNKLYEPILDKGEKAGEIQKWMEQYGNKADKQQKDQKKDDNEAKKKENKENENNDKDKQNNNTTNNQTNKNESVNNSNQVQISFCIPQEQIKVDTFNYEKMIIPKQFAQYFQELDSREFSIFEFFKENQGNELAYVLIYLFEQNDCFSHLKLKPQQLFQFGNRVQSEYRDNPYHNKIHSVDVTQTMNFFIKRCFYKKIGNLTPIDIGTMYVAAAIHDLDHPGFNNVYQINMKTELTILYNDKSPLENHHISKSYRIMMGEKGMNIFENLPKDKLKGVRDNIIQMIISTDMSYHFSDLAKLKGRTSTNDFNPSEKDKQLCMSTLLHACDISNPFKPFHIYQGWAQRVLEEFWIQGDNEREFGSPITYLCDRYTTNTAKSQIGFIDFIVKPFYEAIQLFLPEIQHYLSVFEQNKEEWQSYEDYYTKQLEILEKQRKEQVQNDKKSNQKLEGN